MVSKKHKINEEMNVQVKLLDFMCIVSKHSNKIMDTHAVHIMFLPPVNTFLHYYQQGE